MRGHIPWNKGLMYPEELKSRLNLEGLKLGRLPEVNEKRKGKRNSPDTEFKKGQVFPRGENHWLWRGGKRGLHKSIRQTTQYKEWRTAVFERDNYTCQTCGLTGTKLNADHIKTFASILEKHSIDSVQKALICAELWNIVNGRTLCVECHQKTDTWGGRRNIKSVVAAG